MNSLNAQPPGLANRVEWAIQNGKSAELLEELDKRISAEPDNADLYILRGSLFFRTHRVKESLVDFDVAVEKSPEVLPYLWQRGISQYYAGEYRKGLEQFEVHRTVNPNDVENAFWHFLCAAKLHGIEKASQSVLLAGQDNREPLMQVQLLIQGKLEEEALLKVTQAGGRSTKFYGYLYLGLYADVAKKPAKAIDYLEKCLEIDYPGYMHDVAKVHLAMLKEQNPVGEGDEKSTQENGSLKK
ncbi:tetratricopeptide repeat protein [Pirellulaceae bacterium SH449]